METGQLATPRAGARDPEFGLPAWHWTTWLWFAALLALVYAPVLAGMLHEWATVEEMGHGFFVPLVAGYVVWRRREQLRRTPLRPSWSGLILVVWGFIHLILGTAGADFFIPRTGFLLSLVGVLWMLGGRSWVAQLAFPLLLLPFMIRIPLFIYSQITLPLQLLASRVAEVSLLALGIPVLREGNVLELANQRLSVVEACSGIRSLLSLSFLSLVYSYLSDPRVWMRFVLLAASVPIAILANAFRVTMTGVISEYDPALAQGFFHQLEGWSVFMIALLALILTHRIINIFWRPGRAGRASDANLAP